MNKDEMGRYWLYFKSLCSDLENTTRYIEHKNIDGIDLNGNKVLIKNTDVCSIEFLKLLLATGSEFEIIGKLLCKAIDNSVNIDDKNINIIVITEIILSQYPKIISNKIYTNYETIIPLKEWKIDKKTIEGKVIKKVKGLDWWEAYNGVKHNRYDRFCQASLRQVIDALGSLLIIELYFQQQILGDIKFYECDYFHCDYFPKYLVTDTPKLPDAKD